PYPVEPGLSSPERTKVRPAATTWPTPAFSIVRFVAWVFFTHDTFHRKMVRVFRWPFVVPQSTLEYIGGDRTSHRAGI
ncbi:MAG: hypothetical protein KDA84_15920, partial [Planctomycetaceae bacterium]|nr:hypothetical protein [Planctomycetaceae bacterium]